MTCLSLFVLLLTPAYSSDNTLHKAAGTSNPDVVKATLLVMVLRLMLKINGARLLCMHAALNNPNPDVVKALVNAGAEGVTQAIIEIMSLQSKNVLF